MERCSNQTKILYSSQNLALYSAKEDFICGAIMTLFASERDYKLLPFAQ